MKACASCSGGVMFVPDAIERVTNKQQSKSYNEIVGEDAQQKPVREKIFGVFKRDNRKARVA